MYKFTSLISKYTSLCNLAKIIPLVKTEYLYHFIKMGSGIYVKYTQIARFVRPTWGPAGSWRPQVGPKLAPWILLSGHRYVVTLSLMVVERSFKAFRSILKDSCMPSTCACDPRGAGHLCGVWILLRCRNIHIGYHCWVMIFFVCM